MTPEEYAKVKELFAEAIRLKPEQRDPFLRLHCDADSTIYREVYSLLRHHRDGTVLKQPSEPSGPDVTPAVNVDPYLVLSDSWEDNRELLRRRLMLIATALAILSGLSTLRLLTTSETQWDYGARIFATMVTLAIALRLHLDRKISIDKLRINEWLVLVSFCLLQVVVYVQGIRQFAAQGELATVITLDAWHYVAWTMILLVYGMFMPNTWQRAAKVLLPLSLAPAVVSWCVRAFDPVVAAMVAENQFGQLVLAPIAAAVLAIYAANLVQGARLAALQAKRLAQYRIVRQIGDGGMGQVFEAEHLLLKRACAVKLIRPEQSFDSSALARFEREVQTLARLTHPHTIEVYDYGKTKEGVFFYAMELLKGMNLAELVKMAGPLPPQRAIHFLIDVCDALAEAHQVGMIHRDIKPANIFASQCGGIYDFTKLLDFGVVRDIRLEESGHHSATWFVGTPSYMSPEQVSQPLRIDARSDLYAVGAVGYHLLSGRPPFLGKTPMDVLAAVVEERPDPLSRHRSDVPPDLERILMRCLEKDPARRFANAKRLRKELLTCQSAGQWTREAAKAWWNHHAGDELEASWQGNETLLAEGDTQAATDFVPSDRPGDD